MNDIEHRQFLERILEEVRELKGIISRLKPDPFAEKVGGPSADEELRKRVATFDCPECGEPMKLRRRRMDNEPFMGCVDFPECKGLRDITGNPQPKIYD